MINYQLHYWRELTQLKEHCYYVNEYISRTHLISRFINCFLAIASSSSIGAWIIWQKYAFIWGAIIAVSQVVNVIKQFLPFEERAKYLPELKNEIDFLVLEMEKNWFSVAEGRWTIEEIHNKRLDFKTRKTEILQKNLANISLPDNKKLLEVAKAKTREYFKNFS